MSNQYHILDRPDILSAIFHTRPQLGATPTTDTISDHLIPVEEGVRVGARFHLGSKNGANLLFFHGNGEIAADYDDLGPLYNGMGINLLAVDYRGYGMSDGHPTVSAMMADCHSIFEYAHSWLHQMGYRGPLILMGRSLGSASAIAVAARHQNRIGGLIIESGFAHAGPLLRLLGVDLTDLPIDRHDGFENLDKISICRIPTLIIHAEFDHIIPYSDGQALFKTSGAEDKQLLKIDGANHNDILMRGFDPYMQAIVNIAERIAAGQAKHLK